MNYIKRNLVSNSGLCFRISGVYRVVFSCLVIWRNKPPSSKQCCVSKKKKHTVNFNIHFIPFMMMTKQKKPSNRFFKQPFTEM